MSGSCPRDTSIRLESGICVSKCPSGYVQSSNDETECVQNIPCPSGFSNIPNSNVECNKPFIQISSTDKCQENYEEWTSLKCYQKCPSPLLSNGTTCLKPTITRDATTTTEKCTFFHHRLYVGGPCVISSTEIIFGVLLLMFIVWIGTLFFKHINFKEYKSTDEELINNINNYFLQK